MKRSSLAVVAVIVVVVLLAGGVLAFEWTRPSSSSSTPADAKVRVLHAAPDAPAVDVWVNGAIAFSDVPYKNATSYASLPAGAYSVKVVPHGETSPLLTEANLTLKAGVSYTVAATESNDARIRVVHAAPDAPPVDVLVNGAVAFSDVAYKTVTSYASLPAGMYNIKVVPHGETSPLLAETNLTVSAGVSYTVAATESSDARVRVFHASPDAPSVDVWVNGAIAFSNVAYKTVTSYASLPAGMYNIKVVPHGETSPLLAETNLTVSAGVSYTVAAIESSDARVRVVHASPNAPPVDVLVNGTVAFSDVAYKQVTPYAYLPAGTYNITVVPHGASSPTVIQANLTLAPGTSYTVVAEGNLSQIHPVVLVDSPLAPPPGNASLRFVHASPDAPAVDVGVHDGATLISDITYGNASGYVNVTAGTYDLDVRVAGTDTVALALGDVTLKADTTYTAFAVGLLSNGSLGAVLTSDAPEPIHLLPLVDRGIAPPTGDAAVRFVHLSPDAPAVDVGVHDGATLIADTAFGNASPYLNVSAGTYDLDVRVAGTTTVALALGDLTLAAGTTYTAFAVGLLQDSTLGAVVSVENAPPIDLVPLVDRGIAPPAGDAAVRFVHLSPDAPAVDVGVHDGATLIADTAFGNASPYLNVSAGTYDLDVRVAGTTTVALALGDISLSAGVTYTAFAVGLATEGTLSAVLSADPAEPIHLMPVVDSNSAPPTGDAQVRFVHLSPDAPAVDVAVAGGSVLFSDERFGQVSPYINVTAQAYPLEVRLAGTNTVVLSLGSVSLAPGKTYTAYAVGLAGEGTLGAVLVVDQ